MTWLSHDRFPRQSPVRDYAFLQSGSRGGQGTIPRAGENLRHETSCSLTAGLVPSSHPDVTSLKAFWLRLREPDHPHQFREASPRPPRQWVRQAVPGEVSPAGDHQYQVPGQCCGYANHRPGLDGALRPVTAGRGGRTDAGWRPHFKQSKITNGRRSMGTATESCVEEGNPRQCRCVADDWIAGVRCELDVVRSTLLQTVILCEIQ